MEDTADGAGKVVKSISGVELLTRVENIENSATENWTFKFYRADKTTEQTTLTNINSSNTKYIEVKFNPDATDNDVIFWIELADDRIDKKLIRIIK